MSFTHILNELDKAPEIDAQGWLIFLKRQGPFPVIFCVHGSDNWAGHHHEHILNFLEAGFAFSGYIVLTPRRCINCEDQMSVTAAMMMVDTFEL